MLTDIITYFSHAAVVVFGLLTLLWVVSVAVRDASLVDIFWGFGFLVVGTVCLYLVSVKTPYIWLLGSLPIIWGLRLTLYLGKRNLGIFGGHGGEDKRYVNMRRRAKKTKGLREMPWRLRSLFTIYWGQGLLIMIVSAPIWVAMASAITTGSGGAYGADELTVAAIDSIAIGPLAILGAALWLIGFLFEAIGDAQLATFLKRNKGYDGPIETKPVMDHGLWKFTRHPNYFGNACMWWGIWLIACQAPWGWATVFAPIIMTLLLTKVSGRDLLERDMGKRKTYQAYMERTSSFFPRPSKI